MRQREGCGMSCVKRENLIGGKERGECFTCFEGKKDKKEASYMPRPS